MGVAFQEAPAQPWFKPSCWLGGVDARGSDSDRSREELAFYLADVMEQGLACEIPAHLEERAEDGESRTFSVGCFEGSNAHILVGEEDTPLLIAIPHPEGKSSRPSFDLFVGGDPQPPASRRPAYQLLHDERRSCWELRSARCPDCEYRASAALPLRVSEMPRVLLRVRQEVIKLGVCGAKIPLMHVDLPPDGEAWCEACCRPRVFPCSWRHCSSDLASCHSSPTKAPATSALTTRLPKWDAKMKAPTLDFGGRCQVASVRNFQLTFAPNGQCKLSDVALMFGKVDSDLFFVEVSGALTPVQAFAMALTTAGWPMM